MPEDGFCGLQAACRSPHIAWRRMKIQGDDFPTRPGGFTPRVLWR
jgi:hypothetical protein